MTRQLPPNVTSDRIIAPIIKPTMLSNANNTWSIPYTTPENDNEPLGVVIYICVLAGLIILGVGISAAIGFPFRKYFPCCCCTQTAVVDNDVELHEV